MVQDVRPEKTTKHTDTQTKQKQNTKQHRGRASLYKHIKISNKHTKISNNHMHHNQITEPPPPHNNKNTHTKNNNKTKHTHT